MSMSRVQPTPPGLSHRTEIEGSWAEQHSPVEDAASEDLTEAVLKPVDTNVLKLTPTRLPSHSPNITAPWALFGIIQDILENG